MAHNVGEEGGVGGFQLTEALTRDGTVGGMVGTIDESEEQFHQSHSGCGGVIMEGDEDGGGGHQELLLQEAIMRGVKEDSTEGVEEAVQEVIVEEEIMGEIVEKKEELDLEGQREVLAEEAH